MESSKHDDINPLRPYYIPPSIGPVPSAAPTSNSTGAIPNKSTPSSSNTGLSSSAREFLTDLSYGDYISDASPTATEVVKGLLDQAVWKYTSVLLAHPFEVSKTVLQVYDAGAAGKSFKPVRRIYGDDVFSDVHDSDSDPDEPAYFTSSKPAFPSRRPERVSRHGSERSISFSSSSPSPHTIVLSTPSLLAALSQLWQQSGAWGVWAGANTSFIYGILLKSLESFSRSLLSALFNLPDPSILAQSANAGLDVVDAAYPWTSLSIAVAASAIAALITSPIDIVRTRLMLTPPSHPPRSLFSSLSALPSQTCPSSLVIPTTLHAALPTLLSASTPLFLRSKLALLPTTSSYQFATFFSSVLELGIRLPLETVLRRGQLHHGFGMNGPGETVVPVGEYRGVLGTMWWIVREEGESGGEVTVGGKIVAKSGQRRKGQGTEGLIRGWRVGIWGLVGVWGASALGGATSVKGGEF